MIDHLGGVVEGGRRGPIVPRLHHDLDHVHAVHVGALDLTVQVVHVRRMVPAAAWCERKDVRASGHKDIMAQGHGGRDGTFPSMG